MGLMTNLTRCFKRGLKRLAFTRGAYISAEISVARRGKHQGNQNHPFLPQWVQDLRDVEYFSMRKEVKQEHYAGVTMSEIPRLPENVTRMREDGRPTTGVAR